MNTVDEFWASFFGLDVSELLSPEPKIVPHAGLQGYHGVWVFRRGFQVIISAPSLLVAELSSALQPLFAMPNHHVTDEILIDLLGERTDKIIGPAFQGFLPEAGFHPVDSPVASRARLLIEQDVRALADLRVACDIEEWEHSDIEPNIKTGRNPVFGCFIDDKLVAAATYRIESGAAFPGLITHPDFRNRGFGRAVLSKAVGHGLNNSLLLLYQTLVANKAAIAAAQSLGFKPYATHLALRLK